VNARKTNYSSALVLAVTTLVVTACSSNGGDGYTPPPPPPPPQNTAPTVMAIADRDADQDTAVSVDFGVSDAQTTDAARLAVTAKVDGTALFPEDGVELSGTGATRTLKLTPLERQTGSAMITITAADPEGLTTTRTFRVTVNAKSASGWAAMQSTLAKSENEAATQLNGFTHAQDASSELNAYLPAAEPVSGIE
jgi:hypothetical protein